MGKIWYFIIIVIILLIITVNKYGDPDVVTLGIPWLLELGWNTEEEQKEPTFSQQKKTSTSNVPPEREDSSNIVIDSVELNQKIYEPGEIVNVSFIVTNKKVQYNVTVDWLYSGERKHGWSARSIDYHNITISSYNWYSWRPIKEPGNWEAHIKVNYEINGIKQPRVEELVEFRVI